MLVLQSRLALFMLFDDAVSKVSICALLQIFVLDRRTHKLDGVEHHDLNGPSLLAFNDAMVKDEDWDALQTLHQSSKSSDSKYG
jgi:hypothetical protein